MCDYRLAKHVVTYDPADVEQHYDSTDFDDFPSLHKKHNKRKPFVKKTRAEKEFSVKELQEVLYVKKRNTIPKRTTTNSSISICHHCGTTVRNCPERYIPTISQVDRNSTSSALSISRVNLVKNKISSILFRNSRATPFVENNKCKVYCADCQRRQRRKHSRKQEDYASRSVYLVEDVPTGLLNLQTDAVDSYHILIEESFSNTNSHSTNCETELWKDNKSYKSRKDDEYEKDFKKEYLKYRKEKEKRVMSRSQQYSKHDMYQVFASQNQYCQADNSYSSRFGSSIACGNSLPATASGFWEFFVNKLAARYQEAKSLTGSIRYCQTKCGNSVQVPEFKRVEGRKNGECQTQPNHSSFEHSTSQHPQHFNVHNTAVSPKSSQCNIPCMPSEKESTPMTSAISNTPVACACTPNQLNLQPNQIQANRLKLSSKSTQVLISDSSPCQEPHDDITKVLKEKYNGEVLCIHNPPCVLINGCLNLPHQAVKTTPISAWPVMTTQEKMTNYFNCKKNKKTKSEKIEQACQHHPPYGELQKYPGDSFVKSDKPTQSICNHNPPCPVVPCCFKPNFDPLVNYVHGSRYRKIPERSEEVDQGKIFEVPECSRNYTVARSKCTQEMTSAGIVCKHQPPCMTLPRCHARAICNSIKILTESRKSRSAAGISLRRMPRR